MTTPDLSNDPVAAGRDAWARLSARHRKDFGDWILVARGIQAGRDAAMVSADCKTPYGKKFTAAMGAFLRQSGFCEIPPQVRARLAQVLRQLPEIERWRDRLEPSERADLNHPDSIWFAFRRDEHGSRAHTCPRPFRPPNNRTDRNGAYQRPVRFNQDMIRRAAMGMGENFCNDVFKLTSIALSAAIRNQDDLFELIPAEPTANASKPKAPIEAAAVPDREHADV